MTKLVEGIGRGIGDVVKGVGDAISGAVKGVGDLVTDIAKSPLGKALLIAGAVYFGGAALAGGFGSSGAGLSGFLSGMGTGVSTAASTLSSAWTGLLEGTMSIGQAASNIGGVYGTAFDAAAGAGGGMTAGAGALVTPPPITGAATGAVEGMGSGVKGLTVPGAAPSTAGLSGASIPVPAYTPPSYALGAPPVAPGLTVAPGALSGLGTGAATAAKEGLLAKIMSSQYTAPALISAGTQIGGALISGAGQKQAAEEEREYQARMAEEAKGRYNTNVGGQLQFKPKGFVARYMPPAG